VALSDAWVIVAVQGLLAPLDRAMIAVTALGDEAVLGALAVAVYATGRRRAAFSLCGALLASAALNLVLKFALRLPRPPAELQRVAALDYAFPSGHAQLATSFWTLLGSRIRPRLVVPLGAAVVSVVCLSRLYLGVHYLGDVLAGVAVGVAVVAAWRAIEPRLLPFFEDRRNAHLVGWSGAGLIAAGIVFASNPIAPAHATLLFLFAGLAFAHSLESDLLAPRARRPDWAVRLALSLSFSMPLVFVAEWLPPLLGSIPAVVAGLVGASAAPRVAARLGA
jgi:membrane-associated phospholipid phosphatase